MSRNNSLFQTRYQPLWIDISPEIAIFTGQNLNKLKDRADWQRPTSVLHSWWSWWCKEWLGFMVIQPKSSRVCGMDEPTWERRQWKADIACAYHTVGIFWFQILPGSQEGLPPHLRPKAGTPSAGLWSNKPAVPATLLRSIVHVSWQEDVMLALAKQFCSSCFTGRLQTYFFWR